jgi:two-component system sensor histidine kinase KdpD
MPEAPQEPARPDPEVLLERIKEEEGRAACGRLKVFFGASAGVGKTYAMLAAARQLRVQGLDVVIGVVETHGRAETEALLEGLERLPLRELESRGRIVREFDIDAALRRRPALILVDELAHTNAPGSRHPKRHQDIEELLAAGIDVFTTVNVQHFESLNDIVGGITGIRVWETVPDRVFDRADEVVLVDLPPDELLQRLKEGKVYLPEQAEHAAENFFRKGNLIALRELALRRTADRVDEEVRAYRRSLSLQQVWPTRESLLACIGPAPGGETVVRAASRLAARLGVGWHAIYAETPALQRLPEEQRRDILTTLQLAHEQGAVVATLPAQDAAAGVVDYARKHNLTKIVIGRETAIRRWPWQRGFAVRLARLSPDIDVVTVAGDPQWRGGARRARAMGAAEEEAGWMRLTPYAWTLLFTVLAILVATPLLPYFELTNIVMLFLLGVVVAAVRFGRGPAMFAAFANVLAFDFFFVPPRFTLAVSDVQYLLTFGVLLIVGLVIGHLAAGTRYQAQVATHREERARDLYQMARELSAALTESQIVEISDRFIRSSFRAKAALLLADLQDRLVLQVPGPAGPAEIDTAIAQWVFDRNEAAGIGTDTLPASPLLYLPLKAPMRVRGVLVVEPAQPRWLLIPEQRRQLDTFAALIAIALERVHFVSVAQEALVNIESERLRNSLLSALSHDLRTPLTALVGLADTLAIASPPLAGQQEEIARAIREESLRMSTLVNNILDMARLESGEIRLHKQWESLEEVIGAAIRAAGRTLGPRRVNVHLPPDMPLVEFDALLIERVLVNLLENAGKYTPLQTQVSISAEVDDGTMKVTVADNGPGLPPGQEEALFEKFARGRAESATPGVGLGLAICRAIVEAHGGRIRARNLEGGGAEFTFTLPRRSPPAVVDSDMPIGTTASP